MFRVSSLKIAWQKQHTLSILSRIERLLLAPSIFLDFSKSKKASWPGKNQMSNVHKTHMLAFCGFASLLNICWKTRQLVDYKCGKNLGILDMPAPIFGSMLRFLNLRPQGLRFRIICFRILAAVRDCRRILFFSLEFGNKIPVVSRARSLLSCAFQY